MGFPVKICLKHLCCNTLYKYKDNFICDYRYYKQTVDRINWNNFPNCPEVAIFIFILLVRRQPTCAPVGCLRLFLYNNNDRHNIDGTMYIYREVNIRFYYHLLHLFYTRCFVYIKSIYVPGAPQIRNETMRGYLRKTH